MAQKVDGQDDPIGYRVHSAGGALLYEVSTLTENEGEYKPVPKAVEDFDFIAKRIKEIQRESSGAVDEEPATKKDHYTPEERIYDYYSCVQDYSI